MGQIYNYKNKGSACVGRDMLYITKGRTIIIVEMKYLRAKEICGNLSSLVCHFSKSLAEILGIGGPFELGPGVITLLCWSCLYLPSTVHSFIHSY